MKRFLNWLFNPACSCAELWKRVSLAERGERLLRDEVCREWSERAAWQQMAVSNGVHADRAARECAQLRGEVAMWRNRALHLEHKVTEGTKSKNRGGAGGAEGWEDWWDKVAVTVERDLAEKLRGAVSAAVDALPMCEVTPLTAVPECGPVVRPPRAGEVALRVYGLTAEEVWQRAMVQRTGEDFEVAADPGVEPLVAYPLEGSLYVARLWGGGEVREVVWSTSEREYFLRDFGKRMFRVIPRRVVAGHRNAQDAVGRAEGLETCAQVVDREEGEGTYARLLEEWRIYYAEIFRSGRVPGNNGAEGNS